MAATTEKGTEEVAQFRDKCRDDAQVLIETVFPRKIVELDHILSKNAIFNSIKQNANSPRKVSHKKETFCPPMKKGIYHESNQYCKGNDVISQMISLIKPEVFELLEYCQTLKMWITLHIPKKEDGNNFGVGVQEFCLDLIQNAESDLCQFCKDITMYHLTRAKSISKTLKYPFSEDYKVLVEEIDQTQMFKLRLTMCEVRNSYSALHDCLVKNEEKLRNPKSSHISSMY